jgi:hypothetical protein
MAAEKAKRHALDFTNVKEGGGISAPRVPAGDYRAKIVEVREEVVSSGANQGQPMWNFVVQLTERRSATYPYRCTLVENQLWKVRNILIAAGKQVPKKRVNVDPNNVIGSDIGITLEDGEYEGREKSEIAAVFPASELADDDSGEAEVEAGEGDDPVDEDEAGDLDLDDL